MNNTAPKTRYKTHILFLCLFFPILWGMALAIWWSMLWHANFFSESGGELPRLTIIILETIEMGLPFMLAGLFSVPAIYYTIQQPERLYASSAWLLCYYIGYVLATIVAITLPIMTLCGEFVPGQSGIFGNQQTENVEIVTKTSPCR